MSAPGTGAAPDKRAEIFTYESSTLVYAMNWSVRPDKPFRLGVASFLEECSNYVQILQVDDSESKLLAPPKLTFRHDYPPTKLMFIPDKTSTHPDLLATTGEFLRIWKITDEGVVLDKMLVNSRSTQFCAPLTSFDWSDVHLNRLGVASIDTTCTVWDVERGEVDTQLIAHDKEVYDLCWGGATVFGTVSADGSVRIFDLRDREHSTIIYESPECVPLLRLAWNKQDPRYLAALALDSNKTIVVDIRYPSMPCAELWRHSQPVNCVTWAPHSAAHICTAGDDSQVLIWELSRVTQGRQKPGDPSGAAIDPILAYNAGSEINQLQWSTTQPDWLGICFNNRTQILRV